MALACAACGAVLSLSAWLKPSPTGSGTHEQLGLPPCGWATVFGKPCPTCGMTTSFALAAHGDLLASFRAQPFGLVLVVGTAVMFWVCLHAAATGSRIGSVYGRMFSGRLLWALAAAAAGAWAYKWVTWPGQ